MGALINFLRIAFSGTLESFHVIDSEVSLFWNRIYEYLIGKLWNLVMVARGPK